jgi:hypothetical protein
MYIYIYRTRYRTLRLVMMIGHIKTIKVLEAYALAGFHRARPKTLSALEVNVLAGWLMAKGKARALAGRLRWVA